MASDQPAANDENVTEADFQKVCSSKKYSVSGILTFDRLYGSYRKAKCKPRL